MPKSFKEFVLLREAAPAEGETATINLPQGFKPPSKMRPVIRAFLNSGKIKLQDDTSGKPVTMPKKTLYLVGGPVRDHVTKKTPKDFDLATNATPEQIAHILSAGGFKHGGDRSGKGGKELHLPSHVSYVDDERTRKVEPLSHGDNMFWFIKGRDSSPEKKPFVISAVVDGEEFEIATFRRDSEMNDGEASVDFVDNPNDDAHRRDLTMNAMYIPLTKEDGENKTLHDPTGTGHADAMRWHVRTVGKAEDRFNEDPIRTLRAIGFHARGNGDDLDADIKRALPKFKNLPERVAGERIRDEFLKRVLHPETDVQKYIKNLNDHGLMDSIFPGLRVDPPESIPPQFNKANKALALAWLLQHNSPEAVDRALSPHRKVGAATKPSGWESQERRAILFLLRLKEFSPNDVWKHLKQKDGTGLSERQIEQWVDMFPHRADKDWGRHVKTFASYKPSIKWDDVQGSEADVCPYCHGNPMTRANCPKCKGTGRLPPEHRGQLISSLETERFKHQARA